MGARHCGLRDLHQDLPRHERATAPVLRRRVALLDGRFDLAMAAYDKVIANYRAATRCVRVLQARPGAGAARQTDRARESWRRSSRSTRQRRRRHGQAGPRPAVAPRTVTERLERPWAASTRPSSSATSDGTGDHHDLGGFPIARSASPPRITQGQPVGRLEDRTEWHRIVLLGKQAESLRDYLKKANRCTSRRIETRSWDDKDGQKRYMTRSSRIASSCWAARAAAARRRATTTRSRTTRGSGGREPAAATTSRSSASRFPNRVQRVRRGRRARVFIRSVGRDQQRAAPRAASRSRP